MRDVRNSYYIVKLLFLVKRHARSWARLVRNRRGMVEWGAMQGPTYIVIEHKTFKEETLTLDNYVFKNCTIEKCKIYYSGGPFELIDTHITESELILNQPARQIWAAIQIFKTKSPGSTITG